MAAVLKLCQSFPVAVFYHAMNLINALAFGVLTVAAVRLSPRLAPGQPRWLVGALLIGLPVVQVLAGWEVGLVACGTVVFCTYSLGARTKAWVLGLIGGAVALMNVPAMLFLAVWSAGIAIVRRWEPSFVLRMVGVTALVCVPWMIRNQVVLGSFCLRDNFALELQISNNDYACPQFHDNVLSSFPRFHPNVSFQEALRVRQIGEVAYNRSKLQTVLHWIGQHPRHFLQLTFLRTSAFWFPDSREQGFSPCVWLITALSVPGMMLSLRRRDEQTILMLALLVYSLPYLVVQATLRYRTPVVWVTVFFAAETMWQAALWWTARSSRDRLASDMLGD
jgi:hypothetical protein